MGVFGKMPFWQVALMMVYMLIRGAIEWTWMVTGGRVWNWFRRKGM